MHSLLPVLRILHLSDLHAGPPFLEPVGAALRRRARELAPDVIAVSGDFTQRAKRTEFRAARAFLDGLPQVPRVLVPGNHDVPLYRFWERLFQPHGLYRHYLERELNTVLSFREAVIVGLDSTDPYRSIRGGRLAGADLRFCERAFDEAAPGAFRVVVLHHAPLAAAGGGVAPAPRGAAALETFARLGVDLVLAGHLHRTAAAGSLDLSSAGDPVDGVILVQCGTSTSRRGRGAEPNAFNWIELAADAVGVTHYLYRDDPDAFVPGSRHLFARGDRGARSGAPSLEMPRGS